MKNWIEGYLNYIKGTEGPKDFHIWTALSILAASLERRVFMPRGHHMIYPNLYIVLVAESAMQRKSSAAEIGIDHIIRPTGEFRVVSIEKATRESIYIELSDKNFSDHSIFLFADELITFLGTEGFHSGVIPMLTSLYTSPVEKEYKKVGDGGVRVLTNVNINFLACTTFSDMGLILPKSVVDSGFAGRVLWISSKELGPKAPWGAKDIDYSIRDELRADLIRMKNLIGPVQITPKAYDFYANWYNNYTPDIENSIMDSYYGRKGTTILKLSILFKASEINVSDIKDLILDTHHIKESIKVLESIEPSMMRIYGVTGGALSKLGDRIINYIEKWSKKNKGEAIPHSLVYKNLFRYINSPFEAKEAIEFLIEMKMLEKVTFKTGGKGYLFKCNDSKRGGDKGRY